MYQSAVWRHCTFRTICAFQRHGVAEDGVSLSSMGSLPSKEQMASKGLEAKVISLEQLARLVRLWSFET